MPIIGIGLRWGAVPSVTPKGFRGVPFGWLRFMGSPPATVTDTGTPPRYGGVGWKKGQFKRSWLPAEVSDWWEQYDRAIARTEKIRDQRRKEAAQRAVEAAANVLVAVNETGTEPPLAAVSGLVAAYEAMDRVSRARKAAEVSRAAAEAEAASQRALNALADIRAGFAAIEEENIAILMLMA